MGLAQISQVIKDPSSIVDLLFGVDVLIGDIQVDVLLEERVTFSWSITSKTVESGLPISDSRKRNPTVLVLEILQMDDEPELSPAGVTSLLDGIQTWQDKWDRLKELANADTVLTVVTPLGTLPDLAIKTLAPNQTKDKMTGLWCRVEFQEMRVVSTETSNVDPAIVDQLVAEGAPEADTQKKRKHKATNKGKKGPKEPSEKEGSVIIETLKSRGIVS
jgi:predicted transcriptional regulator